MNQFKRLTIPSRSKGTTLTEEDGLFSKAHFTSQYVVEEDQITLDLPAMPNENLGAQQTQHIDAVNVFLPGTIPFTPRPTQRNRHLNGDQISAFPTIPFTPRPTQHNGPVQDAIATAFQPITIAFAPQPQINAAIGTGTDRIPWESLITSATQSQEKAASKWAFLLELPHLTVYMIGAMAIFGLYLIIPLMNLLNATVPGNLNALIIALGILALGELLVCFILARTISSEKVKKGRTFVQP